MTVTACATDEETDDDTEDTSTTEDALSSSEHRAFNFFVNEGLTKVQSAGVIGNLMQESSVNPKAIQPGGPGRGIAQWSVGGRWDTSRNDNVTALAARHNESRWALDTQLKLIWYELTTFSGYGLSSLRGTRSVTAAVKAFQDRFEICGRVPSLRATRAAPRR